MLFCERCIRMRRELETGSLVVAAAGVFAAGAADWADEKVATARRQTTRTCFTESLLRVSRI
jgi:hypothetical protein